MEYICSKSAGAYHGCLELFINLAPICLIVFFSGNINICHQPIYIFSKMCPGPLDMCFIKDKMFLHFVCVQRILLWWALSINSLRPTDVKIYQVFVATICGLSSFRYQAIYWTRVDPQFIAPFKIHFNEISFQIQIFSFMLPHLNILSATLGPCYPGADNWRINWEVKEVVGLNVQYWHGSFLGVMVGSSLKRHARALAQHDQGKGEVTILVHYLVLCWEKSLGVDSI